MYSVVPISAIEQSDSVTHVCNSFLMFFPIMVDHRMLSDVVSCAVIQ